MDAIAREVGREPWEIRQENLVQGEQMPYVNVTGKAPGQRRLSGQPAAGRGT